MPISKTSNSKAHASPPKAYRRTQPLKATPRADKGVSHTEAQQRPIIDKVDITSKTENQHGVPVGPEAKVIEGLKSWATIS